MDKNDKDKGLTPDQYRSRLMNKLNCLIAVLEVAITKIERSLLKPGDNSERLEKIRGNLENTLAICRRARTTLEKNRDEPVSMPEVKLEDISRELKESTRNLEPERPARAEKPSPRPSRRRMSYRDYVELSSVQEYQKFKRLPPIKREELDGVELDKLINKFMAG